MLRRAFWGMLMALVFLGCAPRGSARFPVESITVPNGATAYSTEAQPDGPVAGPGVGQLEARIRKGLAERGHRAEADGTLAATANWCLAELYHQHQLDQVGIEAASRHFGFTGVVALYAVFDVRSDDWQEQVDRLPSNLPITRYGIFVSPSGSTASLVLGAVEIEYAPIARDFEPGQSVTLRGQVGSRFKFGHVYLTKPDGTVEERRTPGRAVEASFALPAVGQYKLEVMGDGPTGPVILSNLPLYVGIPEPPLRAHTGRVVDPEQAELRMLVLLNEARKAAGVAPVVADPELRQVAAGHTEDMADHHFFGHVSPTTGTPEDRAKRSGVLVSIFGENIAFADTPEAAHEGLMGSPGHRANMLRADFTHVGIASTNSETGLIVTMAFGRRPSAASLPTSAADVETALLALRASKGAPLVSSDPVYRVSAQAAADVLASGGDAGEADKAMDAAMQREVQRLRSGRPGGCVLRVEILELSQLSQIALLTSPTIRRFGIGARVRRDAKGARLSSVFLLEGAPCR
jgi:uncharacterized protein YkwD